jgi:DUF4097 and DUF4098 domain-containing protein YvlB
MAFSQAQIIEKSYPFTGQKLEVDMDFGSEVIIKSWDKNEINVKVTYKINEGKQNDLMDFKINNAKSLLEISIDVDEKKSTQTQECCCDDRNVNYWNDGKRSNRLCADITVEIFMPKQSDAKVKTIVASVLIEGVESNLDIETVTGAIVLNWPENLGAQLTMDSTTGDIYTNFDLDTQRKNGLPLISGHKIETKYKNGGFELKLKSVTSDISFKKAS